MANSVRQHVGMDVSDYVKGQKAIRKEQAATELANAKSAKNIKDDYQNSTTSVIKNNAKLSTSLKNLGKDFLANVKNGTVVAGTVGLAAGVKSTVSTAAKEVLSLDKAMKKMGDRYDFSAKKLDNLRTKFKKLSVEAGIGAGALAAAGDLTIKASGDKETPIGIESIAKASKLGGGEASDIARTVIDSLKGRGLEFNEKNVKDFLDAANVASRKGELNLAEAIKVLGADAETKDKTGLTSKENAAFIAAATSVNQDRESSIAGLNAVMRKSVEGFGADSALGGLLGVQGGFMTNGKFDMKKLRSASDNLGNQGLGKNDFIKLLQTSGLSRDETEGLYAILSDFDEFEKTFKDTINDQKTLNRSFSEATDNLPDNLKKLNMGLVKATDDILSPLSNTASDLIKGNFKKAFGELPDNLSKSAQGVADNPRAVAGSLATLGLAGALTSKLGLFGGTTGGLGKGLAIEKATGGDVESVYVVNADEIGSKLSNMLSPTDMVKGGKMGKLFGGLKAAGAFVGKGLGVGAAGFAGYKAGELLNDKVIDKFQIKSSDGFEGNIVEQLFHKLDSIFGGENSKMLAEANGLTQSNTVKFEVVDNGERFSARPMADNQQRNPNTL